MKKFQALFVLFCALTFLNFYEVKADRHPIPFGDKDPCTHFWPGIPWIGPKADTLTIGGCTYLIEYYHRTNWTQKEELQIVAYYKISGSGCTATYAEIKKAAYVKLWIENPMGFNEDENEYIAQEFPCIEYIASNNNDHFDLVVDPNIVDSSLFSGLIYSISPNGLIVFSDINFYFPCTDDVCCVMDYVITRVGDEIVIIEWWDPGMGGTTRL